MDKVSGRLVVAIVFLLWAVIGFSGYFNVANSTTTTSQYHVSDSTFKMSDWWKVNQSTNDSITFDNRNNMPHSTMRGDKVITLSLTQYTDSSTFESKEKNLKNSLAGYVILNNENITIEGIKVKFINSTDSNNTKTFLDYYFQKNGKYYSIQIVGETFTVNELLDNAIKNTIESIISTIN